MILETGKMRLVSVREILSGEVNDVIVCREESGRIKCWYTVWIFKDHAVAARVLEDFESTGREEGRPECFSYGACLCFLFPYIEERPLKRFYMRDAFSFRQREEIWMELVCVCMSSELPFTVLDMLLTDGQLRLGRDCKICLQYTADFENYDPAVTERECVMDCASILLWMMQQENSKTWKDGKLLKIKLENEAYETFAGLYRDIRILTDHEQKAGMLEEMLGWVRQRRDPLFRLMLTAAAALVVIALILLLSQVIFGDTSILRIFQNGFETIGTESLLQ